MGVTQGDCVFDVHHRRNLRELASHTSTQLTQVLARGRGFNDEIGGGTEKRFA